MGGGEALTSGRLTRRTMTWLVVAVLVAGSVEAATAGSQVVLLTLPLRSAVLAANLWALRTGRLSPVSSGRLFLAQAVVTTTAWSLLLGSTPTELTFETAAYGTILPIFALVIAPTEQRRWWSLAVVGVVLVPAAAGLLPGHPELFAQLLTVLAVHGLALATLDLYANRAATEGRMAAFDPLTGLFNRRPALLRLTAALRSVGAGGPPASVLVVDLDHFKDLNDTLGHEAGDDALRGVATALTSLVRRDDVVCRWGGEEFLVLLPETDGQAAERRAERLRAGIAATGVTASVGVAEVRTADTVTSWVGRADRAMYAAKEQGRDRVVTAPPVEEAEDRAVAGGAPAPRSTPTTGPLVPTPLAP